MKRANWLRLGAGAALVATGILSSGAAATVPLVKNAPMLAASPSTTPRHGYAAESSLDWAGYAVTGSIFTSVSGSWTQPRVTCPQNKLQPAAFWVGLDGFSSSDPKVEQVGTDSDCTKGTHKTAGGPSYYAWYEMYPAPAVFLPTSKFPVAPGDVISAEVSVSGSTYTLALSDGTKWHDSILESTTALDSSAEWIAEAPTTCKGTKCKVAPLADFGSVAFTGASANGHAISEPGFTDNQITMTTKNAKIVKAQTAALTAGGTAFKVTWHHN
jgi:hypothetical protein